MKNRIYLRDLDENGLKFFCELWDNNSANMILTIKSDSKSVEKWLGDNIPLMLTIRQDGKALIVEPSPSGPALSKLGMKKFLEDHPPRVMNPNTTYFLVGVIGERTVKTNNQGIVNVLGIIQR